jgi:GT2 family glycosyltransferase
MQKTQESIPGFAIIIPVIHSLDDLKRCLTSLDNLDYPKDRFHVVLVDCHVVQGVEKFLKEDLPNHGFRASTLCIPEQPKTQLPSWLIEARVNEARNYAIQRTPGRCYVFTEDDCTFEPDWLKKIEDAFKDGVGAVGGPDILPDGLGWFPGAIDCVLNSYLGTAGMRRGDGRRKDRYYPRKENMAIPAWVLERVGNFPERKHLGGEMEIAGRIRDADLRIRYLPENPVWHRRITSFGNFIRITAYTASEKVRLMREQHAFIPSPHFLLLLATITGILIALFSFISSPARVFLTALAGAYLIALLACAVFSALRTRSVSVGLGVLTLIPVHHLSLIFGTTKGAFSGTNPEKK